ncbi:MAG TPA: putrescine ABC transporter permease PotH [Holosporales bacterium]|nr:putrescine ABC transporter permease PotH [Holosporales bacterium]
MIALPYGWHILFFLVPFVIVLRISFAESIIGAPPYGEIFQWLDGAFLQIRLNLGNYLFLLEDELYLKSYMESLKIAAIATTGCLILGYPMAYGITRVTGVWRTALLMMVILPFWTSFLIRIYAWIGLLSTKGLINSALMSLGLISDPLPLMDNNFAVSIGLIYSYLPFMILPLYASLEKIDKSYLEAAYDLGCKPLMAFFKVIIPLSYRGIVGGTMLVFIPSVGEFVIPALLGGSDSIMIGKVLWNEFFFNNDWPLASSLVVTLFIVLFIPILLFQKLLSPDEQNQEEND